jgi:hypothetical protein
MSGMLVAGTAGLWAIKDAGGKALVQVMPGRNMPLHAWQCYRACTDRFGSASLQAGQEVICRWSINAS